MEKIILRKKDAPHAASNYIKYESMGSPGDLTDFLKIVYKDPEPYELLKKTYEEHTRENKSDHFCTAYLLGKDLAVVIDQHITFCTLCERTENPNEKRIPWRYICSSRYMGDTWWFTDEEILSDLMELNSVDFLLKYKGI